MEMLADKVWLLAALVAAVGMLGLLHVIAVSVENEVRAHDLRIAINRLRQEQTTRLRDKAEATQARFARSVAASAPAPASAPDPKAAVGGVGVVHSRAA